MPRHPSGIASSSGPFSRVRKLLLLTGLSLLIPACGLRVREGDEEKAGAFLNPRRPASLLPWKDKKINGEFPGNYASPRTAILLPGDVELKLRNQRKDGNTLSASVRFRWKSSLSVGCAVPVTGDGYFLTAAHCVRDIPRASLLVITKDKQLSAAGIRVVWQSGPGPMEPDLALLHAPLEPYAPMSPQTPSSALHGRLVFTNGVGSHRLVKTLFGQSGGRISSLKMSAPRRDAPRSWTLFHSAPLAPGDSGGPLMDEEGRLLGINTSMDGLWLFPSKAPRILFYRGIAEMMDPAWLQSLISKDRADRKTRSRG